MAQGRIFLFALFATACAAGVQSFGTHAKPAKHSKRRGAGAMLLQKMESFIQSKGQIGLNPAEQAEVMEIRQILNMDILPTLLQAAQEAQNEIDSLYQRVLDCQVEVVTGLQINVELWDDVIKKQKNFTDCWSKEVLIIDEEEEVCKQEERIRKEIELPAIPPPDHSDNLAAYNYLKQMSDYFCGIEKIYKDIVEKCRMVKRNHTETHHWCETITVDYEIAICGWDAELNETCTEYMGCWHDSVAQFNKRVADLTGLEEDQKAELESVQRLDCLWEAWNYSSDPCIVNITMVKRCEEIPINFTNVTLVVPELPEPRTCPPPPKPGQDNPPLPCSDEFMNAAFSRFDLPAQEIEDMKEKCRPCVHLQNENVGGTGN